MPNRFQVGRIEDFPEGSHRIVRVGNREIGIFNIAGTPHAIPNLCPHQRGPLCEGTLSGTIYYGPRTQWNLAWAFDGEVVTCPWHGLEFHVPTGRCLGFPDIRLRRFEITVSNGDVTVVA